MIPTFSPETFNMQTLQACLQYVVNSFEWLAADGNSSCSFGVSTELDFALAKNTAETIRILLSNAHTIQNRFARIHRLPPETLATIFQFLTTPVATEHEATTALERIHFPLAAHICRWWRSICHSTPKLWTAIWISLRHSTDHEKLGYFLSRNISRSGALPLSVYLRSNFIEPVHIQDILDNMSRIEDLRLDIFIVNFLLILTSRADQLRTLQIHAYDEGIGPLSPFDGWQTPQLRVVGMTGCPAWRTTSFGHLRHLTLTDQFWGATQANQFLHVLASNPFLEELILSDLWVPYGLPFESYLLRHPQPRLKMTHLKRLYIRDHWHTEAFSFVIADLISSTLEIGSAIDCAKYHSLVVAANWANEPDYTQLFPPQTFCVPTRLFIDPIAVAGTDGKSALYINHDMRPAERLLDAIDVSQVEELWVYFHDESHALPIAALREVNTLVIMESARPWLRMVLAHNLFPALQELRIIVRSESDGPDILHFLACRAQRGQQIRTLRFIRDPREVFHTTFNAWQRHYYKFQRYVARLGVFFHQPASQPVMELPVTCTSPCLLQEYWNETLWRPYGQV